MSIKFFSSNNSNENTQVDNITDTAENNSAKKKTKRNKKNNNKSRNATSQQTDLGSSDNNNNQPHHDIGKIYHGYVSEYGPKGFGFTTIRDPQRPNIRFEHAFVHRRDIISNIPNHKIPKDFLFLRKGEKIQFQLDRPPLTLVEREEAMRLRLKPQRPSARNIQYGEGQPIPAVRRKYLWHMEHANNVSLGVALRKVMTSEMEGDQQLYYMQQLHEGINEMEQEAVQKIVDMGFDPEDYRYPDEEPRTMYNTVKKKQQPDSKPEVNNIDGSDGDPTSDEDDSSTANTSSAAF